MHLRRGLLQRLLQRQPVHSLLQPDDFAVWHRHRRGHVRRLHRHGDLPEWPVRRLPVWAVCVQRHVCQRANRQQQLWRLWRRVRLGTALFRRCMRVRRNLVRQRLLLCQRVHSLRQPDGLDVRHRRGHVRRMHRWQNLPERRVRLSDEPAFLVQWRVCR